MTSESEWLISRTYVRIDNWVTREIGKIAHLSESVLKARKHPKLKHPICLYAWHHPQPWLSDLRNSRMFHKELPSSTVLLPLKGDKMHLCVPSAWCIVGVCKWLFIGLFFGGFHVDSEHNWNYAALTQCPPWKLKRMQRRDKFSAESRFREGNGIANQLVTAN